MAGLFLSGVASWQAMRAALLAKSAETAAIEARDQVLKSDALHSIAELRSKLEELVHQHNDYWRFVASEDQFNSAIEESLWYPLNRRIVDAQILVAKIQSTKADRLSLPQNNCLDEIASVLEQAYDGTFSKRGMPEKYDVTRVNSRLMTVISKLMTPSILEVK